MTLKVDVVENTSGGPVTLTSQYAAKHWAQWDGVNNIIRDSENMSSATDQGTGQYRTNYSSSFSNGNHSFQYGQGTDSTMSTSGTWAERINSIASGYVDTRSARGDGGYRDTRYHNSVAFGDLA